MNKKIVYIFETLGDRRVDTLTFVRGTKLWSCSVMFAFSSYVEGMGNSPEEVLSSLYEKLREDGEKQNSLE